MNTKLISNNEAKMWIVNWVSAAHSAEQNADAALSCARLAPELDDFLEQR